MKSSFFLSLFFFHWTNRKGRKEVGFFTEQNWTLAQTFSLFFCVCVCLSSFVSFVPFRRLSSIVSHSFWLWFARPTRAMNVGNALKSRFKFNQLGRIGTRQLNRHVNHWFIAHIRSLYYLMLRLFLFRIYCWPICRPLVVAILFILQLVTNHMLGDTL